jgi:predicted flavoprotein YhiN
MRDPHSFDAIVIGAGAAGLMCAIEAGRRGRRVLLLEHADRVGKKILISGGGRCNFTNMHCRPENFISANPHFAKSALARYTPGDFIALVEAHGIAYHEKTLGQLFCDGPAAQIVAMLLAECEAAGVEVRTRTTITSVRTKNPAAELGAPCLASEAWVLSTDAGELRSEKLVIATGGLSIPKMGATAFGYDLARQFGLKIVERRAALVPLVLDEEDRQGLCDLAGVSAEVVVSIGKRQFREKLLVTHRGLSGPAVLQISSYWDGAVPIAIDWAPDVELLAPLLAARPLVAPSVQSRANSLTIGSLTIQPVPAAQARRDIAAAKLALALHLPARLGGRLIDVAAPSDWSNRGMAALEERLHRWEFTPRETEGYEKAEVTAGGVDTSELSAQTMEARRVPGLYFIGEVVDATGQLGGFNFQWAWASGAAAGRAL